MKKFLSHINTAFTLWDGSENKEYILVKGKEYELPADNKHILGLVDQKHLTPVEEKKEKNNKNN